MTRVILVLAIAGALVACDQVAPPASAPGADALAQCADARGAAGSRRAACDAALAQEGLEPAARASALAQRGELKRVGGDPSGALADYNAALAIDAEMNDALLGRAAVLLASGQLDAVEPVLVNVLRDSDAPARAHYLMGVLRARQGDNAAALASLDEAIKGDARNAEAFAARGAVKAAQGDAAAALPDFDAALRLDESNVEARAGRCWARVRSGGDLAAALRDAEAAESDLQAQLCRGLIMLRREDWAEARGAYDAVLLREPANAAALFGRGVARREQGERSEGRADISRAYDFDSDIDEKFERLGVDF